MCWVLILMLWLGQHRLSHSHQPAALRRQKTLCCWEVSSGEVWHVTLPYFLTLHTPKWQEAGCSGIFSKSLGASKTWATLAQSCWRKEGNEDRASTGKPSCRTVYRWWTANVYSETNVDRYWSVRRYVCKPSAHTHTHAHTHYSTLTL